MSVSVSVSIGTLVLSWPFAKITHKVAVLQRKNEELRTHKGATQRKLSTVHRRSEDVINSLGDAFIHQHMILLFNFVSILDGHLLPLVLSIQSSSDGKENRQIKSKRVD